jgi:hypothetical protein
MIAAMPAVAGAEGAERTSSSSPAWGQRLISLPGRAIERLEDERTCWAVLGFAIAAYAALALWLTRGTTFYVDEVGFFQSSHGFEPNSLLAPLAGHLVAIPRAIYVASFKLFGASYIPFRLVEVTGVALVAGLFFVFAKRRVGGAAALAPTLVLLFFGTTWENTLSPLGIPPVYSLAAGLGALLALDRDDRRGDLGACLLLVAAVASFSWGLAFVAGAAVSVLLRPDRWHRVWIFLIPLALYGAWSLAESSLDTSTSGANALTFRLSNLLLIPNYTADFVSAVAAAITGLNYDFSASKALVSIPNGADTSFGPVVAAFGVAALVIRVRRGGVPRSLWIGIAVLLGLGTLLGAAVSPPARTPFQLRYMYPGAVAVLIVAVEAARGLRISRGILVTLLAMAAVSLTTNIAHFREGGAWLRSYSASARADFTAIELARGHVDPAFAPSSGLAFFLGVKAGQYLAAVDRIGSPAFTPAELQGQSEAVRSGADSVLATALGVKVTPPAAGETGRHCHQLGATGAAAVGLLVRPPGALLRSPAPAQVAVGRFGTGAPVQAGSLTANVPAALPIPADKSPQPWHVTVATAQQVTVCQLTG